MSELDEDDTILQDVKGIAAGTYHSVALKENGTLWCWGSDASGQQGNGTQDDLHAPMRLNDLIDIVAIGAGRSHTVALKSDGSVWAWGTAWGSDPAQLTPVQVTNLPSIKSISVGLDHTVAISFDHQVWAWGSNVYGQLGDGTTVDRASPVHISSLGEVMTISASGDHTLVLKLDGTVWAWGNNASDQLGYWTWWAPQYNPIEVPNLSDMVFVHAGMASSFAIKADGTVWAWGENGFGQLGVGDTQDRSGATLVSDEETSLNLLFPTN